MISAERWSVAQCAEAADWAEAGTNSWRLIHELTEHAEVAEPLHDYLRDKTALKALEVGVGPLGIGFLAVHAYAHMGEIVGVEPLPILEIEQRDAALTTYARALQDRVKVIQAKGEELPFDDDAFDITSCVNVIDHTHVPDQVLEQIGRVTRNGGLFVFGVGTLSFLGRLKWRLRRALQPNDHLYAAHPYIYGWGGMRSQLLRSGWSVLWDNRPSLFQRVFGHGRMSLWIAKRIKPEVC